MTFYLYSPRKSKKGIDLIRSTVTGGSLLGSTRYRCHCRYITASRTIFRFMEKPYRLRSTNGISLEIIDPYDQKPIGNMLIMSC
jgi:hypothetical protein